MRLVYDRQRESVMTATHEESARESDRVRVLMMLGVSGVTETYHPLGSRYAAGFVRSAEHAVVGLVAVDRAQRRGGDKHE